MNDEGLRKKHRNQKGAHNYQRELDEYIDLSQKEGVVPTLLLHSCCAPCSSYVLEYMTNYFDITILYYNPNIYPPEEYDKRVCELRKLTENMPMKHRVKLIEGRYDPNEFFEMAKGLEKEPEGGKRCFKCYEMRLREAAKYAKDLGLEYFTTTLTISPLKSSQKLNEIAESIEKEYGVKALPSDFKKKEGYKRSIELSKEYNLYRQDYCGCVYSH
ncbi:MAG: epoxyqueuosine reductase QueH [Eubacterium sp.]|nr:epoxyqueuosine reductase QueH [Eubacterium sp.]